MPPQASDFVDLVSTDDGEEEYRPTPQPKRRKKKAQQAAEQHDEEHRWVV